MGELIGKIVLAIIILFIPALVVLLCWIISFGYFELSEAFNSRPYAIVSISWAVLSILVFIAIFFDV